MVSRLWAIFLPLVASAGLKGCRDTRPACPRHSDYPILVLGAGVSGLAAARTLSAHGCRVVVLEAKGHVGGRLYSQEMTTDKGATWYFHHGANWLHGDNPLFKLNEELKLMDVQWLPRTYLLRTRDGKALLFAGNRSTVPGADIREDYREYMLQHDHFQAWLQGVMRGDPDLYYPDLPSTYLVAEYLRDRNMTDGDGVVLDSDRLDTFLSFWGIYQTLMEGDDLSRLGNLAQMGKEYGGDREYMVGAPGYSALAQYLAKGLHVEYNTAVSRVEYGPKGVVMHIEDGRVFHGSVAVVTLPLGVLKHRGDVAFEPDLPSWKWRAIDELAMGVMDKVFLEWEEAWWTGSAPDALWRVRGSDSAFHITSSEFYNLHNMKASHGNASTPTAPVLLSTPTGYWAKILEEKTDNEVVEVMMSELRSIFVDLAPRIPPPKAMYRTKWWRDRRARGAYMSPPVGSSPHSLWDLGRPVAGRLFFAGEATSMDRFGYVDGAYETGLREAGRVLCSSEGREQDEDEYLEALKGLALDWLR